MVVVVISSSSSRVVQNGTGACSAGVYFLFTFGKVETCHGRMCFFYTYFL